jgi:MerR family transcriptional regulator, light-induced transcriptional regulator
MINLSKSEPYLSISAVERETGLSKDVLRKWETRYGFPYPERDQQGERAYTIEQVTRLRLIKRLMDAGMRPSRLIAENTETLHALAESRKLGRATAYSDTLEEDVVRLLKAHELEGLRLMLQRQLLRLGLGGFILNTLVPVSELIGDAWSRGELEVFEEHLYTEVVQSLLRASIAALSEQSGRPRVLLSTLPGEQHGLGLLMVSALLSLEGAYCISLGTQTPMEDIENAVRAQRADIVALSFSPVYPTRQTAPELEELATRLAGAAEIWAGGAGTVRLKRKNLPGIRILPDLDHVTQALADWRSARA